VILKSDPLFKVKTAGENNNIGKLTFVIFSLHSAQIYLLYIHLELALDFIQYQRVLVLHYLTN
jgi:hypothetical protein